MILPGSTIGILGGGQLGRMSILAGRRMGYHFGVYEPKAGCTAGKVADWEVNAEYEDEAALLAFAERVDGVTLEFENIAPDALTLLESRVEMNPRSGVLTIAQDRVKEKNFFKKEGFPCSDFYAVDSVEALREGLKGMQGSCVLKTARLGYDGKGQVRIEDPKDADIERLWKHLGGVGVLEEWVTFDCECSVIVARNAGGDLKAFPVVENTHSNHILDTSIVPARVSKKVAAEAVALGKAMAEQLGVVGLLAVEFFVTDDERILVNEIAPRPHNSGHYTLDVCVTSQFEQHIRAVCGLPLGETALLRPAVMVNLLGDLWRNGEPDWSALLRDPWVKLHLYDKGEARNGRKMGHVCVMGEKQEEVLKRAERLL